jgi:hypothetical protein
MTQAGHVRHKRTLTILVVLSKTVRGTSYVSSCDSTTSRGTCTDKRRCGQPLMMDTGGGLGWVDDRC